MQKKSRGNVHTFIRVEGHGSEGGHRVVSRNGLPFSVFWYVANNDCACILF
jgi:hypothetical protein